MITKCFLLAASVLAICAACSSLSSQPYPDAAMAGDPAPVSAATRTILITPHTKYVNITGGEIIRFVVNDKSFAWNFDSIDYETPFDLNIIAPPGVLDHAVTAYVDPNPAYLGGGGGGHHGGHGGGGHGGR